jgi:hypothetical protein
MAYRTMCLSNLRQLGVGVFSYAQAGQGEIGMIDVGRSPGDSWKADTAIASGGSPPWDIDDHGRWLVGGHVSTTDVYFCPTVERKSKNDFWMDQLKRKALWGQSASAQAYFRSGGKSGNKSSPAFQTLSHTSYQFNEALLGQDPDPSDDDDTKMGLWGWPTYDVSSTGMNQADGVEDLRDVHPVLMDARTFQGNKTRYHRGLGMSILGGDGHAVFANTRRLTRAGLNQSFRPRYFNPWKGIQRQPMPKAPIDDAGDTSDWYGQWSNPYSGGHGTNGDGRTAMLKAASRVLGSDE